MRICHRGSIGGNELNESCTIIIQIAERNHHPSSLSNDTRRALSSEMRREFDKIVRI